MKRVRFPVMLVSLCLVLRSMTVFAVDLGISGTAFTLDGQPGFLTGISYYGALAATPDFIRLDLDDMQRHGFNWIRVWATWSAFTNNVSAVDAEGNARQPYLERLAALIAECDRRGMVVDVTLSRADGFRGATADELLAAHQRAVFTLVSALKKHRNWYLDLANERNIRDSRYVSIDELRHLGETVKRLDPTRLITASHAGGDLSQEDIRKYLIEARIDFLAAHRPREAGSAEQTEGKTKEAQDWMRQLGRLVPINYQEPFRRGYSGWQPGENDFLTDLRGTQRGGAAGWCFHNGDTRGGPAGEPRRSFDLSHRRLFEQWDESEQRFLNLLKPGNMQPWFDATPEEVGLDPVALQTFRDSVGGRGCVIRHGKLVFSWGDIAKPGDVASAAKPFYTHFLMKALETERIPSLDEAVICWEPRLAQLNPKLEYKDRTITWRNFANQTSCYGLEEKPGSAFCYNDWQMALFIDLLVNRVYAADWPEVDQKVLHPFTDQLGCEDHPTLLAFGADDRPGRLAISPRDFARFGQFYLQTGHWLGRQYLRPDLAAMAVGDPLPALLSRAGIKSAEMLPGQRTLGSQVKPDNQTDHFGSYSWLWWVNGVQKDGKRHWPDAPTNTFAALGHGGIRGLVVMPSLDMVASWNDSRIESPAMENEAFKCLIKADRAY